MKTILNTFLLLFFLSFFSTSIAQNNALSFDGSDDMVFTNLSSSATSVLTIEFWVYFNDLSNQQNLVHINDGNDSRRIVPYKDASDQICLFAADASGDADILASGFNVQANEWYHLAFIYNDRDVSIYVNGILENSGTLSKSYALDGSDRLYLAADYGIGFISNIKMDEFRLWNNVRTESEIRQNMYREIPNPAGEANLVTYYQFNETSGTTVNDSKGSNNGTLNNYGGQSGYWQTSPAFFGPKNCLEFDGSNDYVTTGNDLVNLSNDMTVEAWFNTTDNNWYNSIATIEKTASGINDYLQILTNSAGNLYLDDANNANLIITTDTYNDGLWHHVAFVRNASIKTIYLYADGVLKGSQTYTYSGNLHPDQELRFGNSEYLGGSYQMNGMLDEIRVWDDVRTETEIRDNMCKSLTGNENGLVGYFTFDNTSGTTLQDLSGNGHDGTLVNMDNNDWVASSAFNTWLNTTSTSWSTASNWSRGSVPTSSDNVHIEQLSSIPSSSSDLTVNNLVVASNSAFDFSHNLTTNGNAFFYSPYTIYSGDGMTVNGDFFYDDSKSLPFTIESGGSLITNGNVSGSINIERTIGANNKWHLISMPNNNTTTSFFEGYFLQQWDEPTTTYYDITDLGLEMEAARGFALYDVPDSKTTFTFSGAPNSGEISNPLSLTASGDESEGMNLVGNPYPSAIDWDQLSGTYGTVYVWDPSENDFIERTNSGMGDAEYIAPTQGFFIFTDPGKSIDFTIDDDVRTHSGATGFYKSSNEIENGLVLSTNQKDKLYIKLTNEANNEFDFYFDARKIVSLGEGNSQIYSKYFDTKLAIDCRPETDIIQLGYQNNQTGHYSIELIETDGLNAELEDTKLNNFHDLTKGAYNFNWDTSDSEERFILHLKATGTENLESKEKAIYCLEGRVYIRQNETNSWKEARVYDLSGRLVFETPLNKETLQNLDLKQPAGAYLVQLIGENHSITEKVVLR